MSVAEHPPDGTGTGFERTPPHDIMAEQSVLGGMLLSKEAITQVVEIVRSADFYRPAHQTVFDVVVDLFSRGEPVDAISVNAELTKRGEIARVGGAPYLHTLTEAIPTAANAGYYARIVADRAVLRRLVEAGTRIAQIGYSGDGEVDDLVDHAQAEIYRVAEKRTGEDYLPLSDVMPGALDEIEAISAHDGSMTGVPTGFTDFDQLSNGLHPGQMVIIAARPAVGKALALDTPLPTPGGWTTMGEVAVGEDLVAADGTPTRVVAATSVMDRRPCYELVFADGTAVVADARHQWPTLRRDAAGPTVHGLATTGEIAAAVECGTGVVISAPGMRPGGRRAPARVTRTAPAGPPAGSGGPSGANGTPPALLDPQLVDSAAAHGEPHRVVAARRVPSVPVRCVQVDHPDHLYLATRSRIPTHNSTLALDFARAASIKHQLTSVFFSLEMGRNEIVMRLLSAEARVPLHTMRSGLMTDDDWARLARRMGEVAGAPLFIDDSPNLAMMEIRAKCRRLKQQHDLKLVVVDYLQLMSSAGRVESRQQEVSEMSRSLKLLAKELEVPVIALSQLNRGPEQRTDKKPQVSDLRESGSIEQDADMVILLYREDVHEKESPRAGEADLIVAKHRNGPTATVTVAFQGHYSRFVDMAPG
ncbi:replicative DNA helicase [Streptomonospora wellingtoniae]|uniref:Replicative DNA helicase n=1 Tax=Streptomonospora wellingtoniae TaxID=3075544 RepID=A0ABU2KRP8_9ACTN|nr:replicative DNA helicase [Streptomonospora sp. DSM 45055]MDT0301967.1 replicative DNA helicase [Streptomonospora sp. DSM 45055]